MMSATTVFAETPATLPSAASAGAAGTTAGAPADSTAAFHDVLAGAAGGTAQPAVAGALPGQAIAQLFEPGAAPVRPAPLALPSAVAAETSAGEMLDLLEQSAVLLPALEAAGAEATVSEELLEPGEPIDPDDEVLGDWLNIMIPHSVLAAQAGSGNGGSQAQGGAGGEAGAPSRAELGTMPGSLQRQAGSAEAALPEVPQPTPAPAVTFERAPAAAIAATAVAASAVAGLASAPPRTEAHERSSTGDEWLNAFGELATTRRAHETAPAAAARLTTHVHDARWADALAHRLVMMAREGESVAQLRLVPQELGPLDIQISVRDGEANVHFGAAHAETRAALESSLPRLRELLSAQGLQLANASVSHQSPGGKSPERAPAAGAVGAVAEEPEAAAVQVVSTSLLDLYA
jgi:flagellar hook-length control protein FliK